MSGKTQGHLTMRTERPPTASAMWLRLISHVDGLVRQESICDNQSHHAREN